MKDDTKTMGIAAAIFGSVAGPVLGLGIFFLKENITEATATKQQHETQTKAYSALRAPKQ